MNTSALTSSKGGERQVDKLIIKSFATRSEMGAFAAAEIAQDLRARLDRQERVRMVFAAAPSQRDVLDALARSEGVDWTRVEAFHMDEYVAALWQLAGASFFRSSAPGKGAPDDAGQ